MKARHSKKVISSVKDTENMPINTFRNSLRRQEKGTGCSVCLPSKSNICPKCD